MPAPAVRHPLLGVDRDLSLEPQLCSLCDAPIPEDEVPLQLFGETRPDGDCFAWVYCARCEAGILALAWHGP